MIEFMQFIFLMVIILFLILSFTSIEKQKLSKKSKLEAKTMILLAFSGSLTASLIIAFILDEITVPLIAKYGFIFIMVLIFSWLFTLKYLVEYLKEKDKLEKT